ncbi:hypothetical protein AB6A40_001360 [Gnathostoma spinigerum]|uniref:Uncharacterized protein n=1 Tax=Gnathostoma spinigerum TaxID=75299 RepID=A0ABD6EB61_9BILA
MCGCAQSARNVQAPPGKLSSHSFTFETVDTPILPLATSGAYSRRSNPFNGFTLEPAPASFGYEIGPPAAPPPPRACMDDCFPPNRMIPERSALSSAERPQVVYIPISTIGIPELPPQRALSSQMDSYSMPQQPIRSRPSPGLNPLFEEDYLSFPRAFNSDYTSATGRSAPPLPAPPPMRSRGPPPTYSTSFPNRASGVRSYNPQHGKMGGYGSRLISDELLGPLIKIRREMGTDSRPLRMELDSRRLFREGDLQGNEEGNGWKRFRHKTEDRNTELYPLSTSVLRSVLTRNRHQKSDGRTYPYPSNREVILAYLRGINGFHKRHPNSEIEPMRHPVAGINERKRWISASNRKPSFVRSHPIEQISNSPSTYFEDNHLSFQ